VLVQHALVPLAVVATGALAAIAGCAAAGALPDHGGAAVLLAVLTIPSTTLCAALSSRRGGRLPPSLLAVTYGDTSGASAGLIFGWIILWPLVAAASTAVSIAVVVHNGPSAVPSFAVALVVLPVLLARGLAAEMFAP
jgi:thiamine transporter ThiT